MVGVWTHEKAIGAAENDIERSASARKSARQNGALKRSRVRKRLQDMILRGDCPPGARLGQEALSRRFGIAQGVVREVLVELAEFGLVDFPEGRRVVVARIDRERLAEAFELRQMHESVAVRRCCDRLTRTDVARLMELAERAFTHAQAGRSEAAANADAALHWELVHLSSSRMLTRLADNYLLLTRPYPDARNAKTVRYEHLSILSAIRDGRYADAERFVRQHIAAGWASVSHKLGTSRSRG